MLKPRLASCLKFVSVFVTIAFVFEGVVDAQLASKLRPRDFSANTMNFANITSTNLVETVAEIQDNEKEVEVGDVDRDGDLDVLIVTARSFSFSGRRKNKLYLNNNGVLQESSQLVTGPGIISGSGGSFNGFASFDIARNGFLRDYDGDGWLDMLIICDVLAGTDVGTTRYYANQHPGGVFTGFKDQTAARLRNGVANGAACGGCSADFNHDGHVDYWLGNYPGPSQDEVEMNDGTGKFSRASSGMRPSDSDYTVDVSSGDINGDGKIDVFIGNDNDPAYIYYNDLNGAGSAVGDFRYTGSVKSYSAQGSMYTALEPGDFNRDGKLDLYFANRGPTGGRDVIFVNTGNDANGKAVFSEYTMPGLVSNSATAKVTVADLNGDGRLDLIVMGGSTAFGPNRRPVIFRNTSVNGVVSFVEWTPAPAFPSGNVHSGWHSAALDVNGDKKQDILIGAMNHDFLFKHVATPVMKDSTLGGSLPSFHNQDPHAILGNISTKSADNFSGSLPTNAIVSAVLRSTAGVTLEVRNSSGNVIASSNRGGKGVEEAIQFSAPGGSVEFRVILNEPSGTRGFDTYLLELNSRSN